MPRRGPNAGKVNLEEKFSLFDEYWSPKVVAEVNGNQVRIVKMKGGSSGTAMTTQTSCF